MRTLLFGWMVVAGLIGSAAAEGRKLAVVVGVDQYRASSDLPVLKHAGSDAALLSAALRGQGYTVFEMTHAAARQPGQEHLTPQLEYVRDEIEGILESPNLGEEDAIVIALHGHGVQFDGKDDKGNVIPQFYFCPADATVAGIKAADQLTERNHLLPLEELYKQLGTCTAGTKLLIVDACRNDPNRSNIFKSSLASATLPKVAAPPGGTAAFFSCKANQRAIEDTQAVEGKPILNQGVFTHFLVEGLNGAADLPLANNPPDGVITFAELSTYVANNTYAHVYNKYGVRQSPELRGDYDLNLPMATANSSDRQLRWAGALLSRARERAILNERDNTEGMLQSLYHIYEQYARYGDLAGIRACMVAAATADLAKLPYDGKEDYSTSWSRASLAIAYAWQGDYASAEDVVASIRVDDSYQSDSAKYRIAVARAHNGDRAAAKALLEGYLHVHPLKGHYIIHQFMQIGDWPAALETAKRGLGDTPVYALRIVAQQAIAMQEPAVAGQALDELLKLATTTATSNYQLADFVHSVRSFRQLQRGEDGTKLLEQVAKRIPSADFSGTSQSKDDALLRIYLSLKAWDRADQINTEGAERERLWARALDGQAVDYDKLDWYGFKIEQLAAFVLAQRKAGRHEAAARQLRRALDPPNGGDFEMNYGIDLYHAVLASQLAQLGNYEKAEALLAIPEADVDETIYKLRRCAQQVITDLGYLRE